MVWNSYQARISDAERREALYSVGVCKVLYMLGVVCAVQERRPMEVKEEPFAPQINETRQALSLLILQHDWEVVRAQRWDGEINARRTYGGVSVAQGAGAGGNGGATA